MKLVYSRNRKPQGNHTMAQEYQYVRTEPERIIHVLNEERGNVTICGAPTSDDPVPAHAGLTNCGNCFNQLRSVARRRRPTTWRLT